MKAAFLLAVLFGAVVLLGRRRRLDLYTVGWVSSCVYFLAGFFEVVADVDLPAPVTLAVRPMVDTTYGILVLVLVAIPAAALLHDARAARRPRAPEEPAPPYVGTAACLALAAGALGLAMTARESGAALLSHDKAEIMGAIGRWYLVWTQGALLAAVLGFAARRRVCTALALGLVAVDVWVGFRSTAAMTAIGLFALALSRLGPTRLLAPRNWRWAALALTVGAGFFLYKGAYVAVKSGRWQQLREQSRDATFYSEVVLYSSEPFLVAGTLNEVVRTGFRSDPARYAELPVVLVPGASALGFRPSAFNDLFQPALFPKREAGLASNAWAEAWSAGRWVGVGALAALYVAGLGLGSRLLRSPSAVSRVVAAACLPYWAFYLHRNDLFYQLLLQRRVLLALALLLGAAALVHRALAPRPRPASPRLLPLRP